MKSQRDRRIDINRAAVRREHSFCLVTPIERRSLFFPSFQARDRHVRRGWREEGREGGGRTQGGKNKRTRSWNRSPSGRRPPDDSATRAPPLNGTLINPTLPYIPPLHQANQAAEPVLSRETSRGRCQQARARARAFQAPSFFIIVSSTAEVVS